MLRNFANFIDIIAMYHKGGKIMNTDKIYAEQIANQYSKKETTKVKQLKKLDAKARVPASIFAYTFGIVCALVLGTGMCLCMNVIGSGIVAFVIGLIVGVLGIIGCSLNYPIYKKILEIGKSKYGSDILRLAKEISDEQD